MEQRVFDLYLGRARKFHQRISHHFFFATMPLQAEFRHSKEAVPYAQRLDGSFRQISEGDIWGDSWDSGWFHLTGEIPVDWQNDQIALKLNFNGEALLFDSEGVPKFGFTSGSIFSSNYRKEFYLLPEFPADRRIDCWVEAAANQLSGLNRATDPELNEPEPCGNCRGIVNALQAGRFNVDCWQLWLDVDVLLSLLETLPPRGRRTDSIVMALNDAANAYAETPALAGKARECLRTQLSYPAMGSAMTAIAVGHAHLDTGYLWPVRETIRKAARTFASQLDLMDRYPDYVFGASSPQHYLFIKQHYPGLYEKIKTRVAEGRWELQGGMWVEADCNLISGESMIRQFLHGKNFFRDEFGIDVKNLWLPDVFGYSANLPQIMQKSGCDSFLTQKLSWSQFNRFPYQTFCWEGIDGSEVITHFPPENAYNSNLMPTELAPAQERFMESTIVDEFLSLYGTGNGGGGPKAECVERGLRQANLEGVPKVKFGRADQLFEQLSMHRSQLPTWVGELYFEYHRGTLTSQAKTKRGNRKLEQMLPAVEMLWSCLPPAVYPTGELDRIWKMLLINQFHDIIPGSSIEAVYEVTEREHAEGLQKCQELSSKAAGKIFSFRENSGIVVNTLSCGYNGSMVLPDSWRCHTVSDSNGHPIMVQEEADRAVVLLSIDGLASLELRRGSAFAAKVNPLDELVLENAMVRYEFNADGQMIRGFDKMANRELIRNGQTGNIFSLYVDRPNNYDAWDIELFYFQQKCDQAVATESATGFSGPVRSGLRFSLKIGNSVIEQLVTLTENSKRLDFETTVQWNEERKMLRVSFPTATTADTAAFDIQYGTVRRPTHTNTSWDLARFEAVGQRFADISDHEYGTAILNDCKYGYHTEKDIIDLALLRSPKFPAWNADQGTQVFTYSYLPHERSLDDSKVRNEAAALNRAPLFFDKCSGQLPIPVRITADSVDLAVIKKAEKSDQLTIRLVETSGRSSSAILHTQHSLTETNLLEWTKGKTIFSSEGKIILTLAPYEIKTFLLQ